MNGRGIFSTKEWIERKKSKKIILQVVNQLSANKHKLTYEDDGTIVICLKNWKGFNRDWSVLLMTMNLWIAAVGNDFLKGKFQHKNKNIKIPAELLS